MDVALDIRTRTYVRASRLKPKHGYRCPCCGAPVFLRRGFVNSPHFAHESGTASEDCENYHPAGGYWSGGYSGSDRSQHEPGAHAQLYLSIADPAKAPPTWQLELSIPQSLTAEGTITVQTGWGETSIPLSRLIRGSIRVLVTPRSSEYALEASDEVPWEYENRIFIPLSGLREDQGNVFRFSENGGRRLPDHAHLYWGRTYFVVGHLDRWSKRVIWPDSIQRIPFAPRDVWDCSIVSLPIEEDQKVSDWVECFLDRKITAPPLHIDLVYPDMY